MANQNPLPLSIVYAGSDNTGVFLGQLKQFQTETLNMDFYAFGAGRSNVPAPGDGAYFPLPSGPIGVEWINTGAAGTLRFIETDIGIDAAAFFRYSAPVPPATRELYIPAGSLANPSVGRITLEGLRGYLAILWNCTVHNSASGTLRSLADLKTTPSGAAYGNRQWSPTNYGN